MSEAEWTFGSLFSGVGGLDLGLERAGWECRWQVENEAACLRRLERHWPHIERHRDVRALDFSHLEAVRLLAGGFPCQDLSSARTSPGRKGLNGRKSGLWTEFARAVGECRPRFVLVENVGQWKGWVPQVRADLFSLGYASLPVELSASSFGAWHRRRRVFVAADAHGNGESVSAIYEKASQLCPTARAAGDWGVAFPRGLGVDDGSPERMDRLRMSGNAVVPQVAEWLGRQLIEVAR